MLGKGAQRRSPVADHSVQPGPNGQMTALSDDTLTCVTSDVGQLCGGGPRHRDRRVCAGRVHARWDRRERRRRHRKIAELPNVQRSGVTYEYKTQLIDMASALEQRWAEVQAQNEKRMMDKTLLSINFDYSLSWARTVIGASAKRRPRGSNAAPDHTMRCSPAIDGGLVDTPVVCHTLLGRSILRHPLDRSL